MSLSKEDSTRLWSAVQDREAPYTRQTVSGPADGNQARPADTSRGIDDLSSYNAIYQKLLNAPGASLRNIPLRIYLPSSQTTKSDADAVQGTLRVVQSLVSPTLAASKYDSVPHSFLGWPLRRICRGTTDPRHRTLPSSAIALPKSGDGHIRPACSAWCHCSS